MKKIQPAYCHAFLSEALIEKMEGYHQFENSCDMFLTPDKGMCQAFEIPKQIQAKLTPEDYQELGIKQADFTLNLGHYQPTPYDPNLYIDPVSSEVITFLEIPHEVRNPPTKTINQEPIWT